VVVLNQAKQGVFKNALTQPSRSKAQPLETKPPHQTHGGLVGVLHHFVGGHVERVVRCVVLPCEVTGWERGEAVGGLDG